MAASSGATIELEHAIAFSGQLNSALQFHPNGVEFICPAAGTVVVGDLGDPHKQVFLRGHDDNVSCLTLSKSGRFLASGQNGENSDVVVWDYASKKPIYRLSEHDHGIKALAFTDDERLLATCGDSTDRKMLIWDMASGRIVAKAPLNPNPTDLVAWGGHVKDLKRRPTPEYVLATCGRQAVCIWVLNPLTGEIGAERVNLGSLQREWTCMVFSDDGDLLFLGSDSGDFAVVNVRTKSLQSSTRACSGGVKSMAVLRKNPSPAEPASTKLYAQGGTSNVIAQVFIGGGDGSITVFSGERTFVDERKTVLRGGAITSISFNGDESEMLVGTSGCMIHRVRKSDLASKLVSENHEATIEGVAYPNGISDRFATCSADGTVRIWDANDYSVTAQAIFKANTSIKPLSTSFLGEALIVGYTDGSIRGYDRENGEHIWDIEAAHRGGTTCLIPSGNNRFFVSGGAEGGVSVWETRSRELVSTFKEHTGRITSLQMFADDTHALSSSKDRTFLCWDLRRERRTSQHVQKVGAINALALCSDQTHVLTVGADKTVKYWDLRSPDPIRSIAYSPSEEGFTVAVSPDSSIFAVGGSDQIVRLFDFGSGRCISEGIGHSRTITKVTFSPDGKQLVSVGQDGGIFVWNVY